MSVTQQEIEFFKEMVQDIKDNVKTITATVSELCIDSATEKERIKGLLGFEKAHKRKHENMAKKMWGLFLSLLGLIGLVLREIFK